MRYEFGGLIFGGAYFRNFTVTKERKGPKVKTTSRNRDLSTEGRAQANCADTYSSDNSSSYRNISLCPSVKRDFNVFRIRCVLYIYTLLYPTHFRKVHARGENCF